MNYSEKTTVSFSLSPVSEGISPTEYLLLYPKGVTGFLLTYTGQRGELYVSCIPSINIYGYGRTEAEAQKSLAAHVEALFNDIFELSPIRRTRKLEELGWIKSNFFKKKYSRSWNETTKVLKDFDNPELVKRSALQAA